MTPNAQSCRECPFWDDINECWKDHENVSDCEFVNERSEFVREVYEGIEHDRQLSHGMDIPEEFL